VQNVMMHDGSWVQFRKVAKDYDPTNRDVVPHKYERADRIGSGQPLVCKT